MRVDLDGLVRDLVEKSARQYTDRRSGRGRRRHPGARRADDEVDHAHVPIDGAAHDVGQTDTAWSYRDATWGSVFAGVDPDPGNVDTIRRWSIDYFERLHPHSAGGAYVNMMMDEARSVSGPPTATTTTGSRASRRCTTGQPLSRQPEHPAGRVDVRPRRRRCPRWTVLRHAMVRQLVSRCRTRTCGFRRGRRFRWRVSWVRSSPTDPDDCRQFRPLSFEA